MTPKGLLQGYRRMVSIRDSFVGNGTLIFSDRDDIDWVKFDGLKLSLDS